MQSVTQVIKVATRWMIRRDMPEVLAIESNNFEFPWSDEDFTRCLRQRNQIGVVAERVDSVIAAGQIVGYMIYELHRTHFQIVNLAVHSGNHRRGVGKAMIRKLADKLHPGCRAKITCGVRESNISALHFLKAQGFRAVSLLRDQYIDSPEDMILMHYNYDPCQPSDRLSDYQCTTK